MAQKFGNGRWVKEGFLDNRIEGSVVGRIVLAAIGAVDVYLTGDFKADIAGEVIQFRNSRFEDDDMAAHVIGDMDNPQIGTVNLISFDPHPNLAPHPYIEWFSEGSNHYRFELGAGEAWIVPENEREPIDRASQAIRRALAERLSDRLHPPKEDRDWI
ncbi:MAG TPA: hypothetical protein VFS39_00725 [Nitrospira sp.]|nr:hypothetical protein [Nitrospira sp.]